MCFLYSGYLTNIPMALEEAACVDGASTWKTYWKIIFPIMKPMHATVAVLTALGTWNDVMTPLVIMSGTGKNTLPLAQLNSRHSLEPIIILHLHPICWHCFRSLIFLSDLSETDSERCCKWSSKIKIKSEKLKRRRHLWESYTIRERKNIYIYRQKIQHIRCR